MVARAQLMNQLVPFHSGEAPVLIAAAGERARLRFLEFFTANIRNPHTRRAYARGAGAGSRCNGATYIEWLGRREPDPLSVPTVKQRLAAIRHQFDWLVVGQ